jgi:DNA-binding MarR family transcriptional regulator
MSPRPGQVNTLRDQLTRELANRTDVLHHLVAGRLGLSTTDVKCLDFLRRASTPLTPVILVELSGLTAGAITGVVDHLESAGFVERVRSTKDRRRWYLHLVPERQEEMDELFAPLDTAIRDLCRSYSDDQLDVVIDFLSKLGPLMGEEIHRLRR